MNKLQLLYGFLIGIVSSLIGCVIFIMAFTDYTFIDGIRIVKMQGNLGKLITLGAILNVLVFFTLLKYKKDLMARGVILATIILAIITILI